MGLARIAQECGAEGADDFPVVTHHPPDDRFVELSQFDGQGACFEKIDDICETILKRSSGWPIDKKRLSGVVFELGQNVEQHAMTKGLVAVQHYPTLGVVKFAVGDFGKGIPSSLAQGGLTYASDLDAVRAAVETEASAKKKSEPWRGAGLPGLLNIVCDKTRGLLHVQSGGVRVDYKHDATAQAGYSVSSAAPTYNWTGTFVSATMRTGGT